MKLKKIFIFLFCAVFLVSLFVIDCFAFDRVIIGEWSPTPNHVGVSYSNAGHNGKIDFDNNFSTITNVYNNTYSSAYNFVSMYRVDYDLKLFETGVLVESIRSAQLDFSFDFFADESELRLARIDTYDLRFAISSRFSIDGGVLGEYINPDNGQLVQPVFTTRRVDGMEVIYNGVSYQYDIYKIDEILNSDDSPVDFFHFGCLESLHFDISYKSSVSTVSPYFDFYIIQTNSVGLGEDLITSNVNTKINNFGRRIQDLIRQDAVSSVDFDDISLDVEDILNDNSGIIVLMTPPNVNFSYLLSSMGVAALSVALLGYVLYGKK